jgi:hypothetical protein
MSSIVLDLQKNALDRKVPVADLLRMALVVSKKLKIKEFEKWVTNELNGYEDSEIPDYRNVSGEVKAWNPFHGWQPVIVNEHRIAEIISSRLCGQSVPELESLLSEKPKTLLMPFSKQAEQTLREMIRADTPVTLQIASTNLVRIVETARTIILNWSMRLEEDGILGEGMSFSSKEQNAATKVSTNINNFYGPVQGSQIQQATSRSSQVSNKNQLDIKALSRFIEQLHGQIDSLKLKPDTKKELNAEIKTVEAQVESPKPKQSVIKESLLSIQRILEAAGGTIAGELLKSLLGIN